MSLINECFSLQGVYLCRNVLHTGQVALSMSTSIYQASTMCLVQSPEVLCDVCLKKQETQYLDKRIHVLPK